MKESIAHQLGRKVRDLRKKHVLTQEQLAGRSHISLEYIQKIESKNPSDIGLKHFVLNYNRPKYRKVRNVI